MKILLLNQTFHPDGAATAHQLAELAKFLVLQGHQVTVICDQRDYETRRSTFPDRETFEGVEVYRVRTTPFGKRSFFHRIIDGISYELSTAGKLLLIPRQDVVVSFTSPPLLGLLGAIYGKLARCATVQWLMDVNPDAAMAVGYLDPKSRLARFLVYLFEASLRNSSRVVVLDRWMRERAVARGASRENVTILPPWPIHSSERKAASEAEALAFRREHGLEGKYVILYSGNHSIVHPLDTLLEAALALRDDDRYRFAFIGGGVRVQDVSVFREKHGLKNIVQLPYQPRERLPASLACGDLHAVVMGNAMSGLVHTSKLYGVLATGAPYVFIGPKQSHGADLLSEHPYGYHVENGQPEKLVEIIRASSALTTDERDNFSRKNKKLLQSFTPQRTLQRFEKEVLRPLAHRAGLESAAVEEKLA